MNLKALHKLGYGLYVVGSLGDEDKLNVQIANTVFQVCSEPPIIAVAINRHNLTHDFIVASKVFTVSVLSQDTPLNFIGNLGFKSGREIDKLKDINYKLGKTKAPIVLDHALTYFEAKLIDHIDVKTHSIFVGELVDADVVREGEPLTYAYYQQVKRGSTPKSAPSFIEKKKEIAVKMDKYECSICSYVYDPELGDPDSGIKPGTPFADIPDYWVCPVCGATKDQFEKMAG